MDTTALFSRIKEKLQSWFDSFIEYLPNIALALIFMILTFVVAKIVKDYTEKYLKKVGTDQTISRFMSQLFFLGIIVFGIVLALSVMKLTKTVSSILAGLGIIGLAIGFAFQDSAANFISGIYITFYQPFKIGDVIETKGHMGTVLDINLRVSKIQSFNGPIKYVPNRYLFQDTFTNYTEPGKLKLQLDCGISYAEDLEKVEKVAINALQQIPQRLPEEEVTVFWEGFGNSSINFKINVWMEYNKNERKFIDVRNEAVKRLKKAFNENDITIPFPIRTLDFGIKGGSQLQAQIVSRNEKELS